MLSFPCCGSFSNELLEAVAAASGLDQRLDWELVPLSRQKDIIDEPNIPSVHDMFFVISLCPSKER
jgi:hypothetical protein